MMFTFLRRQIARVIEYEAVPYITLIVITIFLLFPIYWIIVTSLKESTEIFEWPPTLVPKTLSLVNYQTCLTRTEVPIYLLNSTLYSLAVTAFVLSVGIITAYGLSIYPYRGSGQVSFSFFATRIIPPQALWLPFVIFFSKLGLTNTRLAVILFQIVLVYPLSIIMLKGVFDSFPRDLVDAAAIDGCSRIRTIIKIVAPITAPGIAAVGIISFLWSWNDFMFPFLILHNKYLYPVTVGTFQFITDQGTQWGLMAATGVLAILPGLIFFSIAQKRIVSGLTQGAVKS
jgi:ABC-type glycerol-3-phosphate transport system permease component